MANSFPTRSSSDLAVLLAFQRPETMAVLLLKCDHTVDEHVALRATLQRPEKFHHLGIAAHPVHRLAVHVTPGAKQEAGRLDHVNLSLTGTGARPPAPAFRQTPTANGRAHVRTP